MSWRIRIRVRASSAALQVVAEMLGETGLLGEAGVLCAQKYDLVVEQRPAHEGHGGLVQRLPGVDTAHDGAEHRTNRSTLSTSVGGSNVVMMALFLLSGPGMYFAVWRRASQRDHIPLSRT
jgi:hypothetical protein